MSGNCQINSFYSELAICGEIDTSSLARRLYSQDASIYQQRPSGVVRPKGKEDLIAIVKWASRKGMSLIPRAGGTSLAGQCVGSGLVVDVSRHMDRVIDIDGSAGTARVEPGVVQDDLNDLAARHGLKFAPDTSTSRQACIGGMIGNNSCGAYSILHGTTRDHVLEITAVLADGSVAVFHSLNAGELEAKKHQDSLEGKIYREICAGIDLLRDNILERYPKPEVVRRNMGYALDFLARSQPWEPSGQPFNLAPLICGSEGTLCLISEALVRLVPLPAERTLICAHFNTVKEACAAVPHVLRHQPAAVELIDGMLLDATRNHRSSKAWRFWVEGEPGGVLAIELHAASPDEKLDRRVCDLITDLQASSLGYSYPVIEAKRIPEVWELRKAGLGLLTGIPGDTKPVTAIEDTAVAPADLPDYLAEMQSLMERLGLETVVYGHASVGLLHLRPMLNLKDQNDYEVFKRLIDETAAIVARYGGSLSGEHGDGRLRGPYIRLMLSDEIYQLLKQVKQLFDPQGIFNPGVIIDSPALNDDWRCHPGLLMPDISTEFDWTRRAGFVSAVEACNGVGLCRQKAGRGALMCPSYMASSEEACTTRGRANVLRQLITEADSEWIWNDPDLSAVMDTCLSCKGCATECPSSVDMSRFKAEVLQRYYDRKRPDLRARIFGYFVRGAKLARIAPRTASWFINLPLTKRWLGIAPKRRIPAFARHSFSHWFKKRHRDSTSFQRGVIALFNDEFTQHIEPQIGRCAVEVFEALGYRVELINGLESGRTQISKGFLRAARQRMQEAIKMIESPRFRDLKVIGLEPSALLGFRDEAPDLVSAAYKDAAHRVAQRCCLFEEFLVQELANELPRLLSPLPWNEIMLHGHCHQKALCGQQPTVELLRMIPESLVTTIPSGCCGMAGSFGYEAEHYTLSMQIGETVLFPAIRANPEALICACGSSCRQQIMDGTGRAALHPAQIIHAALLVKANADSGSSRY